MCQVELVRRHRQRPTLDTKFDVVINDGGMATASSNLNALLPSPTPSYFAPESRCTGSHNALQGEAVLTVKCNADQEVERSP